MEIHIGTRIAEIELISKEDNKVEIEIDGERYKVDVVMAEKGSCSILHEGLSYNAELARSAEGRKYKVNTLFSSFDVEIVDSQTKYLQTRNKSESKQNNQILALMPGKIVTIPVQVGDELNAGDTVIVVEAMKMQSNYKVSADCRIKEILVAEGETVANEQVLILLELKEESE